MISGGVTDFKGLNYGFRGFLPSKQLFKITEKNTWQTIPINLSILQHDGLRLGSALEYENITTELMHLDIDVFFNLKTANKINLFSDYRIEIGIMKNQSLDTTSVLLTDTGTFNYLGFISLKPNEMFQIKIRCKHKTNLAINSCYIILSNLLRED